MATFSKFDNITVTDRPDIVRENARDANFVQNVTVSESVTIAIAGPRYWVGGSNIWNNTAGTKWAYTSGGAGGAPAPKRANDVYFDANSGAVVVQVPFAQSSGTVYFHDLDCAGFTGELQLNGPMDCSGSFLLSSTVTITADGSGGYCYFTSESMGEIVNFFDKDLVLGLNFVGSGGWKLASNLQLNLPDPWLSSIYHTGGTLDTDGYDIDAYLWYSGVDVGPSVFSALYLRDSVITLRGEDESEGRGFEIFPTILDAGTSHLILEKTYSRYWDPTGSTILTGGTGDLYDVTIRGTPDGWFGSIVIGNFNGDLTLHNLTIDATNGPQVVDLSYGAGKIIAENFTTIGGPGELDVVSLTGDIEANTVSIDKVWVADSNATGAAIPFANTNSIDFGNNTGWNFPSVGPDPSTTVVKNFTADSSGNTIYFAAAGANSISPAVATIDSVSLRAIIQEGTDDNIPVKELLSGTTDEGREINFRADTQVIQLMGEFETFATPLAIITKLQRGSLVKCFVALGDEDFYELEGNASKGVSITKVNSKNRSDIVTPPLAREIRISWRDSSKQLCRLTQGGIIFLPTSMSHSE